VDGRELDEVLKMLQQLEDPRIYQNVDELTRRQTEVAERLKRFEFALRREVNDKNVVALSGADEVPDKYRPLAEEYFRSLGRPPR
jgi:hypothetical protein